MHKAFQRFSSLSIELGLLLGVLAAGLWVLGATVSTVRFHDDESPYIQAARYFSYLFVRHDLGRPEWGDDRTIHAQGMVPSYLIGGWLWARGYPVEALHVRIFKSQLADSKIRDVKLERFRGQLIDVGLLRASRTPMVLVSVAAIGVLYLLGRVLTGPVAGLTMAALALASPLSRTYLVQARSEPTLVFFLLLTLLLAVVGARRGRHGRLPSGWALACGVALGLAIGSKYTAILSLVGLLVWGLLAGAWCAWRAGPGGGARLHAAWAAGRGWLLAALVAFVVCVLSNPHFYPDPPLHLWHVVETRRQIVQENEQDQERKVVRSPVERTRMVVGRALRHDTATGSRGVPLEAFLAPLGALALLLTTVRGALRTGRLPAEGLVLVTVATYFVGVAVGFSVSWERYFLPTLIVGTILSGVGLSTALRTLPIIWDRLRGHLPRVADHAGAPPLREAHPGKP
jgi:hypothetical protein